MDNKILTCIYRVCPFELESKDFKPFRRHYFNKLKCFKSFWDSFNNKYTEINIVWDGQKENELFKYISKFPVKIVFNEENGNIPSLLKCYDIISGISTPLGYLIEDDYYHLPDSFNVLIDLFFFSDLVTLYDHPDRYGEMGKQDITLGQEKLYLGKFCHIRTAESTTCSFGFRKSTFDLYKQSLINAAKRGIGSPDDRGWWREMVYNGYRLVSPIPTYSTHLVRDCEAPTVHWEKYSDSIIL